MDWPCVAKNKLKKVPKIFPTNHIARNKICSVELLNGHEWRKVGCVPCKQNVGQKENFMHSNFQMDISLPWIDAAFT